VLESYEPAYHHALPRAQSAASREPVAIVACAPVMPAEGEGFRAGELKLPDSVVILPDVQDHMDRTQVLGIVAASRALAGLPGWQTLAEDTGVALGIEGRTGRGVQATTRVFRDHAMRRIAEAKDISEEDTQVLSKVLGDGMDRILPSGPYTLPGLMPNVAAGRLASVFIQRSEPGAGRRPRLSAFGASAGCRLDRIGRMRACAGGRTARVGGPGD